MAKCSYCNNDIAKGTGKMMVWNTGKVSYFCSRGCEKNSNRHRKLGYLTKKKK